MTYYSAYLGFQLIFFFKKKVNTFIFSLTFKTTMVEAVTNNIKAEFDSVQDALKDFGKKDCILVAISRD